MRLHAPIKDVPMWVAIFQNSNKNLVKCFFAEQLRRNYTCLSGCLRQTTTSCGYSLEFKIKVLLCFAASNTNQTKQTRAEQPCGGRERDRLNRKEIEAYSAEAVADNSA